MIAPRTRVRNLTEHERRILAELVGRCGFQPVTAALCRMVDARAAIIDGTIESAERITGTVERVAKALERKGGE